MPECPVQIASILLRGAVFMAALMLGVFTSACRSGYETVIDFTGETELTGTIPANGENFRRAEYRRFALNSIPGSAWQLSPERQEPDFALWYVEDKKNPLHTVAGAVDFLVIPAETPPTPEGLRDMIEALYRNPPPGHRLLTLDTEILDDRAPLPGIRYRCTVVDERVFEIPWIVSSSGYLMLDAESPGRMMSVIYSERDRNAPDPDRRREYAFFKAVLIRTGDSWTPLLSPRTVAPGTPAAGAEPEIETVDVETTTPAVTPEK